MPDIESDKSPEKIIYEVNNSIEDLEDGPKEELSFNQRNKK